MVSFCIVFIVIVYFYFSMILCYKRLIEVVINVVIELFKGNYDVRMYGGYIRCFDKFGCVMNSFVVDLMEMMRMQEMQWDWLLIVIENIGFGLIMIDGRGFINFVNRFYVKQFYINLNQMLCCFYYDVFEYEEVIQFVEDIFMMEIKKCKLLRFLIKIEWCYFEVDGVLIMGLDDEWKGIVFVFYDMMEIKKLEQMRKDFVVNVFYELKMLIMFIKGFMEILLDGVMEDKEVFFEFFFIILKESERFQFLVQDFFDFLKIEQ